MGGIAGYDATGRLAGRASEAHGKPHGAGQPRSHAAAQWSVRAVLAQNDRGAVGHGADLIEHHGTGIPEARAGPAESHGTGQRPHASDECQRRPEGGLRTGTLRPAKQHLPLLDDPAALWFRMLSTLARPDMAFTDLLGEYSGHHYRGYSLGRDVAELNQAG